jgi:hypothetical protein
MIMKMIVVGIQLWKNIERTIKQNIKKGTLDKIGSFSTEKRRLKLNGDRGRHW